VRYTTTFLLLLTALALPGCGMFVDIDDITFVGPDAQTTSNTTQDDLGDAVADMNVVTVDMSDDDEDMGSAQSIVRACDPFDDQCSGSRRCVVDLTSRSPPHAVDQITCKSDENYSSKREGESCGEQKDCFPGYVCTTTANERERQCVKYCRTTDDCRGNRTCVLHFAEQLGEDLGLCD